MKINKSITIKFSQQEAMDLRTLLYIAKDAMEKGGTGFAENEKLNAFRDDLLDKSYI